MSEHVGLSFSVPPDSPPAPTGGTVGVSFSLSSVTLALPDVASVAARLPARAVDAYGNRQGTFTDETTVKATEVQAVIEEAASLALPRLGEIPDKLADMARVVLTIRAAMAVELRFWPEQTEGEQTTYAQLRQEYRDALADYDAAIEGDVGKTPRAKSLRVRTFYTSDEYLAAFDVPSS